MRLLACLIVAPQRGYDEPATLSYAISSFCPTSADGLHHQWRPSCVEDHRQRDDLFVGSCEEDTTSLSSPCSSDQSSSPRRGSNNASGFLLRISISGGHEFAPTDFVSVASHRSGSAATRETVLVG